MRRACLITLDDVGLELLDQTATPFIDTLRATGREYSRFVAAPTCSNFRAKIETGLYSTRPLNLVGGIFKASTKGSLPVGPHLLGRQVSEAHQFGKWHLCEHANRVHRSDCGYSVHAGSQANLTGESYYDWTSVENGAFLPTDEYATDYVADRATWALDHLAPLVVCSFNAVHAPSTEAPPGMGSAGVGPMLEYLDYALERVLAAARANGYVTLLCADNGGTKDDGAKGNLLHKTLATLLLALDFPPGALWADRELVDTTDLHATLIDWVAGTAPDSDGLSLLTEPRAVAFADRFSKVLELPGPGHREMATDGTLKLVRRPSTGETWPTDWFDEPTSEDVSHLALALGGR